MHATPPTEAAIDAADLTKRYGKVDALTGVSLRVPRGAVFGLIGPNGAGKTTFIKVLLGIVRADGGEVRVLGGRPDEVRVRAGIGYLPENLRLPGVWTPRAFLASVGRLKGLERGGLPAAIDATLRRVGLDERAWGQRMGGFSKGMRQRTGLAAALLGAPTLLVLDEPTDGIDPMGRAAIRGVIGEEAARGATVLLNSHLLAETERLCDRVAIMRGGRIVRDGALDALRARDRYVLTVVGDGAAADAFAARGWPQGEGELWVAELTAADPAALSAALGELLAAGVTVAEVRRDLHSLEDVLAAAVGPEAP